LARSRVPRATFTVDSALTFPLPSCSVVTAIGEVFSYAASDESSAAVVAAWQAIHDALDSGGILLFDVASKGRAPQPTYAKRMGRGWRIQASAAEENDQLIRTIDSWRTSDNESRHHREIHRLQLLGPAWVRTNLENCGFDVTPLGGYDDFGFIHGWDGYLARKP